MIYFIWCYSGGGVSGFPPGQVALLSASSNGGDHLDHLGTGFTDMRQRSAHITFKGLVKKHINSEYFLIINIPYPSCRVLCWPPPWRALTLTSASPLKLNHPTLRAEQTTWLSWLPAWTPFMRTGNHYEGMKCYDKKTVAFRCFVCLFCFCQI